MQVLSPAQLQTQARIVGLCALITVLASLLGLVGWLARVPVLTGAWYAGASPIRPLTSLALIVAALCLWTRLRVAQRGFLAQSGSAVPRLLCILLLLMAGTGYLYRVAGIGNDFSNWTYRAVTGQPASGDDSQMALGTAIGLTAFAFALLLGDLKLRRWPEFARLLLAPAMLAGVWAMIAILLRREGSSNIALNTGVALSFLSYGALILNPPRWVGDLLLRSDRVGRLARYMPLLVFVTLLLGTIPELLRRSGRLSEDIADALLVLLLVCSIALGYVLVIAYLAAVSRGLLDRERLADQESRYKLIVENTHDGLVLTNADGAVLYANPRMHEILGYGEGEIAGLNMDDLLAADPDDGMAARLSRRRAGISDQREIQLRRKDGSLNWTSVTGSPVLSPAGEFLGTQATVADISQQRKLQDETARSLALLQATLEATCDGVVAVDLNLQGVVVNRQFLAMWKVPQSIADSMDGPAIIEWIDQFLLDPQAYHASIQQRQANPMESTVLLMPLKDGRLIERRTMPQIMAGRHVGHVSYFRDITEQRAAEEALRQSKLYLEQAQEFGGVGSWSQDLITGENSWSKQTYRIMGLDPDKTDGDFSLFLSLVHPDDRQMVFERSAVPLQEGLLHEMDLRILRPDGELRWIFSKSQVICSSSGKPIRIQGLVHDITERKLAAQELSESLSILQATLESSTDGIIVVGTNMRINAYNRRFAELWGLPEELLAIGDRSKVLPLILDQVEDAEAFKEGIRVIYEERFKPYYDTVSLKDGRIFERYSIPQLDNGEFAGRVITVRDATERLRLIADLQESQTLVEEAQEMSGIGHWSMDLRTGKLSWSRTFFRLLGLDPGTDSASPEAYFAAIHPEDREQVTAMNPQLPPAQAVRNTLYRVLRGDGSERWVLSQTHLHRDETGNPVSLHGLEQDITERKRAEEEQTRLEHQLLQAQKMEAIGTLAGGIAHDFNNILTAILGYASLVAESLPEGSDIKGDQQEVINAANRATDLVRHILAFSRQSKAEAVPVSLNAVVHEVVGLLRATLPSTIGIHQQLEVHEATVLADPSQIHQVLMNLCTNAGQAMNEKGGSLVIQLRSLDLSAADGRSNLELPSGSYFELSVEDSGCGIPRELLDRIFDPFFTTKPVGEGTGLGLATVHGIVTALGGTVRVTSEVGRGTVFRVYLPSLQSRVVPGNDEAASLPHGTERILFVDDEPALARLWHDTLARLGYQVTAMHSSLDAWEAFVADPDAYDLIITDQTMPGMTGAELAVRMLEKRPALPIILCTGFSSVMSAERAQKLGLAGFINKPVLPSELANVVRHALETPGPWMEPEAAKSQLSAVQDG